MLWRVLIFFVEAVKEGCGLDFIGGCQVFEAGADGIAVFEEEGAEEAIGEIVEGLVGFAGCTGDEDQGDGREEQQ